MLLVNRSLLFTFSSQNCTSLIWKFCFCLKLTVQYGEDNSVGRNFCCTYIHKDLFFSYLLGHKATLSTATLSKIYFFNPPKKLFKFPWYNIIYIEENKILHEIFRVVSRFSYYISCYSISRKNDLLRDWDVVLDLLTFYIWLSYSLFEMLRSFCLFNFYLKFWLLAAFFMPANQDKRELIS